MVVQSADREAWEVQNAQRFGMLEGTKLVVTLSDDCLVYNTKIRNGKIQVSQPPSLLAYSMIYNGT
jgi:hypothetical protein